MSVSIAMGAENAAPYPTRKRRREIYFAEAAKATARCLRDVVLAPMYGTTWKYGAVDR